MASCSNSQPIKARVSARWAARAGRATRRIITMRFLCITVCCIACAVAFVERKGQRDDFNGKAVEFFSGEDKMAARREATPSPDCLEGDMLLTTEQKQVYFAMREVTAENRERVRRDAANVFNVWPNRTLVYKYEAGLNEVTKRIFQEAIDIFREKTNVLFLEAIDGVYTGTIVPLTVQQSSSGCFATVGCPGNGGGRINLQEGVCNSVSVALHEIGHALGRFHEQTRSDRSQYVTVMEANIRSGFEHNFKVVDKPKVAEYDLQSIMHYGPQAFSRDGYAATIVPHNPKDMAKMGKQSMLSRLDAYTFNAYYHAFDICPDNLWSQCRRGGVPNKHCACDCLPAFEGPYCDIFAQPTACSEIHTDAAGSIYSPGYPNLYSSNSQCTYVVECADNEVVQLDFPKFVVEGFDCWYDKMSMYTGDLVSEIYGDEYCDDVLEGHQIISGSNVVVMNFESDGWYNYPGFKIDYQCVPAGL